MKPSVQPTQKRNLKFPFILISFFYVFGVFMWAYSRNSFFLFDLPFIGTSIFIGIMLGNFLPKRHKLWGRITTQFLVGAYMLLYIGLRMKVNMQIEMFFFLVYSLTLGGTIVHYIPAKIVGPLLFNRGWCGWGCWTASVLDLFPWKINLSGRIRNLGIGRFIHFGLVIVITAALWFAFGFKPQLGSAEMLVWFIIGNLLYYGSGIGLAIFLKDNRAFCKYLCPIPPIQKILGRFSLFKIRVNTADCIRCGACEKHCPMDLNIREYIEKEDGKINSTECILCSACAQVCPKKAIAVKFCPSVCTKERLHFR
jgi:ferredoxin-type protein NapH